MVKRNNLQAKTKQPRSWTDEENQFLKKYYPTKGSKYAADKLGRTRSAVSHQAAKLGLSGTGYLPSRPYSPQEILFIKKYYPLRGAEFVAQKLGRTPTAIKSKASDLRVERKSLFAWSDEEIEYLKKWFKKKRPSVIARRLERTTNAVLIKARTLGLYKRFVRMWTKEEELFLIKNFRRMTYKQIGKHLNRTESSVSKKVNNSRMIKKIERNWTPQEKRLLSRLYGKVPAKDIAVKLNRTTAAVRVNARLRNKAKKAPPRYSEKEKNFIRNNYLKMTTPQIAQILNRSPRGIALIARRQDLTGNPNKTRLGHKLKKPGKLDYTEKQRKFIQDNYLKMTNIQIARKLNKTAGGIKSVAIRFGLTGNSKKRQLWKRGNPNQFYSEKEIEFIRNNYLKMTNVQIAAKLGRTQNGINGIVAKLGLTGNPARQTLWHRGDPEKLYTEDEKKFIRKNYLKMTNKQLAVKLTRPEDGIAAMVRKLGLSGNPKRKKYAGFKKKIS